MTASDRSEPEFTVTAWLRQVSELIVCFIIAVIMLRAFILEGYLISTGSMAPRLLGFHKHVVCPTCLFEFPFGVTFDDSVDPSEMQAIASDGTPKNATCPNCGQINIGVTEVPTSHGDQLLIQKHVFDFRTPRRWETIVFRNPADPSEAYVKRVTGLPGEAIQVVDGNIHVDGIIAVKNFETQLDMRIPVADLHHLADSPLWEMPWDISDEWQRDGLELISTDSADRLPVIRFRNWRWSGGLHRVESPLRREDAAADWQAFQDRFDGIPVTWASRIEYDSEREVLRCQGVMPPELIKDLTSRAENELFRNAVFRLAALSHLAPVTDRYGYNAMVASPELPVSDLMINLELTHFRNANEMLITVPMEAEVYELRIGPVEGTIELRLEGQPRVLKSERIPEVVISAIENDRPIVIDVSNFDRAITVGLNKIGCLQWMPTGTSVQPVEAAGRKQELVPGATATRVPAPMSLGTHVTVEGTHDHKVASVDSCSYEHVSSAGTVPGLRMGTDPAADDKRDDKRGLSPLGPVGDQSEYLYSCAQKYSELVSSQLPTRSGPDLNDCRDVPVGTTISAGIPMGTVPRFAKFAPKFAIRQPGRLGTDPLNGAGGHLGTDPVNGTAEEGGQSPRDGHTEYLSSSEQAFRTAVFRERQSRWAIRVNGSGVRVQALRMYRDVHYTPGKRRNAVDAPYVVPSNCYFVQGDNSPVSSDSRNWVNAAVPHHLLLGKPFVVHLPSRPAVLEVGGQQWPIRVPEWSRIRYIH